jgi:hypothetical protein
MSAASTPAPATGGSFLPTSLLAKIGLGALAATLLTVLTIVLWPASEADKARADGEKVGEAVSALYAADTTDEVDAALSDLNTAVADSVDHAGSNVSDQINDQADALYSAADGFVGSRTADDGFEQDVYQAELDYAMDDLAGNADQFQSEGPEVQQAFWDGVEEGMAS